MAKINIVFESRYVSKKTGEAPLKIMVSHKTGTAYIPIDITLKLDQWNGKEVVKHPFKKTLNDKIEILLADYKGILRNIEEKCEIESINAKALRDLILNEKNSVKTIINQNTLSAVFTDFISHKQGGTKRLYDATYNKIKKFEGSNFDLLRFEHINIQWLLKFNDYLSKTAPSANARAIDLRNLRAVINYAIDYEITSNVPFRRFNIQYEETKKRNLDVEVLRSIFNLDNLEPWAIKYRDLFKLTFMLIGINFVDLCGLTDIRNGRIEYIRAKTHKKYSIKVEPEIAELIENYRGKKLLLNYMDTYQSYRHFYNNVCVGLNTIKDKLNEQDYKIDTLTTYWARHSWATIAHKIGIHKDIIKQALGHGKKTVTDIYIDEDLSFVDDANRRVLNYVLYGYEKGIVPKN